MYISTVKSFKLNLLSSIWDSLDIEHVVPELLISRFIIFLNWNPLLTGNFVRS